MTSDPQPRRKTMSDTFHNNAVWLALSCGLACIIAVLTLMPQASIPAGPQGVDKVYHVLAFAALVFPTGVLRPQKWWVAAVLALLFGGMIEVIQPAFGRSTDLSDFLADAIGIAAGLLLGFAARHLWARR